MTDTDIKEQAHESYGAIPFTPVHGQPRTMFGSPLKHTDRIRVSINAAALARTLSEDHIFPKELLFSGYLTHTQFAEAILSLNRGPSVPVTIDFVTGDLQHREDPPERPPRYLFNTDVTETIERLIQECDELAGITKGPASRKAKGIAASLRNSFSFIRERMEEFLQTTADGAKKDLDHSIADLIRQADLSHLSALPEHRNPGLNLNPPDRDVAPTRPGNPEN